MGPKAHHRILKFLILGGLFLPACLWAQSEDPDSAPLGDVARALRKQNQAAPARTVINNDNFSVIMDEAQSHRLSSSSTLVFSFDSLGKNFHVSPSPDVTCSLSFNANATALLSEPFAPRDLPNADLVKLDGPAAIKGDELQIAVFNGTTWKVEEITVGLTIVRRANPTRAYYGDAKLVPAAADEPAPVEKHSDLTLLYHIRGSAPPFAAGVFKTPLNINLGPDQEWHWAIVQARGIPPQ
jgi:hypothetical protein